MGLIEAEVEKLWSGNKEELKIKRMNQLQFYGEIQNQVVMLPLNVPKVLW